MLCQCEIAVMIFTHNDKLFEFASEVGGVLNALRRLFFCQGPSIASDWAGLSRTKAFRNTHHTVHLPFFLLRE